jgi:hypothetical protein
MRLERLWSVQQADARFLLEITMATPRVRMSRSTGCLARIRT